MEKPLHDTLIVFARAPMLGRVKTRLAADIGDAAALRAYLLMAERCWTQARATRDAMRGRLVLTYTPDTAGAEMQSWLPGADALAPQRGENLGDRMHDAMAAEFAGGAHGVVLMGTDCPDLTADLLRDAFSSLSTADVVLGAAADGGYYLIGMSRLHRALFTDIPWSSDRTLECTLLRARALSLSVHTLPVLRDVDTAADWNAWLHR